MIKIKSVEPLENYVLKIIFSTNEENFFDVKPYLDKGDFTELKDVALFNTVKPCMGVIQWDNELDIAPDTLYEDSIPYKKS